LDLKQDVREECEKLGKVTNVILYDLESEGVMSVKFKDVSSAALCAQVWYFYNY
jgi:HIV Tat-specific factor 1